MKGHFMPSENEPGTPTQPAQAKAAEHVAVAHRQMKTLQERIGEHSELAEAIRELELAMSVLTVQTGGFR
jgi:hypothetical protein